MQTHIGTPMLAADRERLAASLVDLRGEPIKLPDLPLSTPEERQRKRLEAAEALQAEAAAYRRVARQADANAHDEANTAWLRDRYGNAAKALGRLCVALEEKAAEMARSA